MNISREGREGAKMIFDNLREAHLFIGSVD
jgi:hypothetical protein